MLFRSTRRWGLRWRRRHLGLCRRQRRRRRGEYWAYAADRAKRWCHRQAAATVRRQKMFRMRVNKATVGQWSAKYIAGMRAARSLEWRCLWSCMGTMAWCAADFCATQPRQLGAARSDFGPGTARRPPDRQEMQRHRARALCDHRRPCWQRSGRSCIASPEPLPLLPAAAANAPLPGASGRPLCAAITTMLTYTTSELFVREAQPLLPPEAAQKLIRVQQ